MFEILFKIASALCAMLAELLERQVSKSEENDDTISFKSIFVFIHPINIANSYQKVITLALK